MIKDMVKAKKYIFPIFLFLLIFAGLILGWSFPVALAQDGSDSDGSYSGAGTGGWGGGDDGDDGEGGGGSWGWDWSGYGDNLNDEDEDDTPAPDDFEASRKESKADKASVKDGDPAKSDEVLSTEAWQAAAYGDKSALTAEELANTLSEAEKDAITVNIAEEMMAKMTQEAKVGPSKRNFTKMEIAAYFTLQNAVDKKIKDREVISDAIYSLAFTTMASNILSEPATRAATLNDVVIARADMVAAKRANEDLFEELSNETRRVAEKENIREDEVQTPKTDELWDAIEAVQERMKEAVKDYNEVMNAMQYTVGPSEFRQIKEKIEELIADEPVHGTRHKDWLQEEQAPFPLEAAVFYVAQPQFGQFLNNVLFFFQKPHALDPFLLQHTSQPIDVTAAIGDVFARFVDDVKQTFGLQKQWTSEEVIALLQEAIRILESGKSLPAAEFLRYIEFQNNSVYYPPSSLVFIGIDVIGAGGSFFGGTNTSGGGGGGGGRVITIVEAGTIAVAKNRINITVGDGSQLGKDTSFGDLIIAGRGKDGQGGSILKSGDGGDGGEPVKDGGNPILTYIGGGGGDGVGWRIGGEGGGSTDTNGNYGEGGNGGYTSGSVFYPENGTPGIVRIWEFVLPGTAKSRVFLNTEQGAPIKHDAFSFVPECDDKMDNDGDGRIDSNDPGCANPYDNDERPPKVVAELTANPTRVRIGKTSTIVWNAQNANSCTVSGTNEDSWSGIVGEETTSAIVERTTYTLTCTNLEDAPAPEGTKTIDVELNPWFREF